MIVFTSIALFMSFQILASDIELETSATSLIINSAEKVLHTDPFFELLDLGEYLLVPLNSLSKYLKINVVYIRETDIVCVTHIESQKEVKIDIENGIYIDHVEWSNQPPVMFDGDFYVSPSLLEYIANVKFDWNPKYQELTITGDWPQDETETKSSKTPNMAQRKTEAEKTLTPTIIGPDFSLGSIQYKMVWEKRMNNTNGNLILNIHGRAGDWAISLGKESEFTSTDFNTSLTYINAKYNENNHLIILGDTNFHFDKTLGLKTLRGVYYTYPNRKSSKLVAYTTVSGKADVGDKIFLYVNDKLQKELIAEEDSFTFTHVPLVIKRVNTIRIVIEKSTGEKSEITKKIAASPKILDVGTKEITAAYGVYHKLDKTNWEGQMAGIKTDIALTKSTSLSWEAARTHLFENKDPILYGSDLSLAFRVGDKTIISLEWLIGGEEENLAQGFESSLLYCLEEGYIESLVFYIPEEVSKSVDTLSGKGAVIVGAWDISKNWLLKAQGEIIKPILEMEPVEINKRQLALISRWGSNLQNTISFITNYEEITSTIDREISESLTESGIIVEHTTIKDDFREKGKIAFLLGEINKNDISYMVKSIKFEENISKIFYDSLLAATNLKTSNNWIDHEYLDGDFESESVIKWGSDNLWISATGKITGIKNEQSDFEFELEETNLNILSKYYFNHNDTLQLNLGHTTKHYLDYSYVTGSLGAIHRWDNENQQSQGKISWDIEYVSPVASRLTPQWSTKLDFVQSLTSEMEIGFKAERIYETFWDSEPEHIFSFSLAHSLAFTPETVQGQKFSKNEHISFIGGIVYLDENGNGVLDENEKRVSGIRMALEGMRIETNQSGVFCFNYIKPGIYQVGFDLKSLPADYNPITGDEIVKIRENENIFLHFGITMNGSISGKLFIDVNANGQLDPDEEPLQLVGLYLNDNEKIVYTNNDGTFCFENLSLGKYTVNVLTETIPNTMKLSDSGPLEILITENILDIEDLLIPVIYNFVD